MFKPIYRQLVYEPFRTLITAAAIASALAVILLLEGFQSGLLIQLKKVALNRGADLIVAQKGVTNFVASRSVLPQLSRQRVEAVDGVVEAYPITMVPVIYQKPGFRKSPVFFVVYDVAGGPSTLKEGHAPQAPREIVIDESLAVIFDLHVGDSFTVADYDFRVAGIAWQASALFTAFAFINYDDMIDFYFDSDLVGDISNLPLLSYLLVELESNADRNAVAAAIDLAEPEGDVFTPDTLSRNDMALGKTLFGPVLGVLIGAGYVIALLMVGMITFATAHARRRDYGVLKAVGFSNGNLARAMVAESLTMMILALPVAVLVALAGAWVIETQVPLYFVPIVQAEQLARTLVGALGVGLVGTYLPYRLIARLDPSIVFRA